MLTWVRGIRIIGQKVFRHSTLAAERGNSYSGVSEVIGQVDTGQWSPHNRDSGKRGF